MDICRDLGLSPDWLRLAEQCAGGEPAPDGRSIEVGTSTGVRVLWIDPDSPPGETRYYDPIERRDQRERLRDSS